MRKPILSLLKISGIALLFVVAAWSAVLWPVPVEPNTAHPVVDGRIEAGEYRNAAVHAGVQIAWQVGDEVLYIGVVSPGTGWIGLGFSPQDWHRGANFILMAVVDGEVVVSDEYGVDQFLHAPDVDQGGTFDVLERAGAEDAQETVVEVQLPLNSGDRYDTVFEGGQSYDCLVAYHASSDNFRIRHTQRAAFSMNLT